MGMRGELFTTQVFLENRTYFFNVKENRNGDVFLQIVESKSKDGSDFDRHQIAVFAEDMQQFFQGIDKSLAFIEKDRKAKAKAAAEKKAAKEAKFKGEPTITIKRKSTSEKIEDAKAAEMRRNREREAWREKREPDGIKRTGKVIHIVSKRNASSDKEN